MEQEYIDAFIQHYKEVKYSIYQCDACGYGQGHQIVYCSKCGHKMVHYKNISAYDLGFKNKNSILWNDWTTIYAIKRITKKELIDYDYFKKICKIVFNL
jgi:hypothetical protein